MISRSALAPCLACAPESVPLLIEDSVIVFLCLLNELLLSCLGRDRLRGRLSISRLFLLALRQRACLGRVRPVKVSRDPVEVFSNLTVLLSFCCCSCLFALVLLPLAAIVDSVKRFLELLLLCSLFFFSLAVCLLLWLSCHTHQPRGEASKLRSDSKLGNQGRFEPRKLRGDNKLGTPQIPPDFLEDSPHIPPDTCIYMYAKNGTLIKT